MDMSVICALGANLSGDQGDPVDTLSAALCELVNKDFSLVSVSRFWRTPAYPVGSGPDYANACCKLQSPSDPRATLDAFHDIEAQCGRVREARWGARTLDLDLIAYGNIVLPDLQGFAQWRDLPLSRQQSIAPTELILPHPRLQDRAFVLIPLAEIAPLWRHPVSGQTVRQMLAALPEAQKAAIHPV
ncbi:2-amino-4-hydroxy-6-hydroxymethyldihydropteridine diphosphokinase [Thioclava sp.]|uniref:2-amino-4-hydroxy-6- hydroxymethyldihydropteridine diphosphokinase n=1 Tax=Thioclava sp. TaxID=1933450 RepID=UPI003AA96DB8